MHYRHVLLNKRGTLFDAACFWNARLVTATHGRPCASLARLCLRQYGSQRRYPYGIRAVKLIVFVSPQTGMIFKIGAIIIRPVSDGYRHPRPLTGEKKKVGNTLYVSLHTGLTTWY